MPELNKITVSAYCLWRLVNKNSIHLAVSVTFAMDSWATSCFGLAVSFIT